MASAKMFMPHHSEDEHWDWWTALSNGYGCSPNQDGSSCVKTATNTKGWNDGTLSHLHS